MCVPAKLYESVGLGVPTLVIAEKNSAAACEARRIGAMTVEVDDETGIKQLIGEMLSGRMPTQIQAKTPISYRELAVEMDRLICESVFEQPQPTQAATESVVHFA
jgi:hypothetical protein